MVPVIFMNADCTLLHGICTIKATFLHLRQIFCSCEHAVAKNGKFNPFPDDPEEGVRRMIQQQPSCKASTSWIKIPYVKDSNYEGWPCSKGTNKVVTIPPGALHATDPSKTVLYQTGKVQCALIANLENSVLAPPIGTPFSDIAATAKAASGIFFFSLYIQSLLPRTDMKQHYHSVCSTCLPRPSLF